MTLVVVLVLGFGAVLVVSAFETDPATGKSVSVVQTIQQIWNGTVNFTQPGQQSGTPTAAATSTATASTPTVATLGFNDGQPSPSYQSAAALAYLQRQQQQRTV